MSDRATRDVERRIAFGLEAGTWFGSAVIVVGLVMHSGAHVLMAGVAVFIALPVLRVVTMALDFLRRRDLRMTAVASCVLAIIVASVLLNLRTNRHEADGTTSRAGETVP